MQALGPMSIALEYGADATVLACPSYRTFLGAMDAPGAVAKTYKAALPPPANGSEDSPEEWIELRPFGMLFMLRRPVDIRPRGRRFTPCAKNGCMMLVMEITIPAAYQPDPAGPGIRWRFHRPGRPTGGYLSQVGDIIASSSPAPGQPPPHLQRGRDAGPQPRTPRRTAGKRILLFHAVGNRVGSY